MISNSSRGK
jgi:hypothetical protein